MTDDPDVPHRPVVEPAPSGGRFISAVWLVPIIAVMIAMAIAWQSYANRGVLVAIAFPDASGVEVGQTTLRFREVTVGVVEDVGFSGDLSQVNVYVRVSRNIAPYLDEDASFWIVQPEVTTRGVEGLNTILSGTYIEGTWDSIVGESRTAFRGDERAPIVPPGVDGTAIVLTARDSARMGPGAPILYRGIEVGEVSDPRLSPDGSEVRIDAFVRAPYDRQLSTATRFWDASGVSATLGASGVELRVGSLAAILEGGVNFDTLISGGEPVGRGHVFTIFEDEDAARASTFEQPSLRSLKFAALFPSALTGLTVGAPIRYRGVRVGVVTSITGFIRPDQAQGDVQLLAVMSLQPVRMGFDASGTDLDAVDFIGDLVRGGMRAKLVSTSILGGDLAVDLVQPEDVPPASLEIGIADAPLIPTVDTDDAGLVASAEGVFERINGLPIEELLGAATDLMTNLNTIAIADETRAIPGAALQTLEEGQALIRDGRNILRSPQTASVLADLERISEAVREITAQLVADAAADKLRDALVAATEAAQNVADGTVNLDELTANLDTLVQDADALLQQPATQELPDAALALLEDGRALVTRPEIDKIVADLVKISNDVSVITSDLKEQEAAQRLNDTLAAAQSAAQSLADGTSNLPELSAQAQRVMDQAETLGAGLNRLTAKIEDLALKELVDSTTSLMQTADAFLSSDEADDVPVALVNTLEELRVTIQTIRTGGTLDNLNRTLDSASGAARSIEVAARDLPALITRLQRLSNDASTLLASYSDGSRVNAELFAALRAATRAAEDVSSLSRTIERNPNSLLLGR